MPAAKEGERQIQFRLPEALKHEFIIACAKRGEYQQAVLLRAVEEYVRKVK